MSRTQTPDLPKHWRRARGGRKNSRRRVIRVAQKHGENGKETDTGNGNDTGNDSYKYTGNGTGNLFAHPAGRLPQKTGPLGEEFNTLSNLQSKVG
ncbi:MAG: hypothetical protein AAF337_02945 [Pseudomonadota bacterium]